MDSSYSKVNYECELQLTQVSENILYQYLSVYLADMLHILAQAAVEHKMSPGMVDSQHMIPLFYGLKIDCLSHIILS